MSVLDRVNSPKDLKKLNDKELEMLCEDIRELLINTVSKTGGHLASNLGVVELTVAMHKVFNSPVDQIVFDVGHQCYTHKFLPAGRTSLKPYVPKAASADLPVLLKVNMIFFLQVTVQHQSLPLSVLQGLSRLKAKRARLLQLSVTAP